ncbi:hypothetical protein CVT26_013830 [Gymnopilus dilepis]|uniref:Zn(2)-C6 fungal-type domain-containing protein n=1 Tax=Gymnopilus dilepis TaxID=231916 RepID=A0A409VVZ9_9AGAR|nr:hypothetical protein CVT26_013830 [Gymnopilus dilepis]
MPRKSEHNGVLRRGSACLSCRRRKLRCDGVRPVCHQCNTMRRSHECAYDDSYRKSRTQTLREKMVALEAKVRELESQPGPSNPSISSPTVFGNSVADNLLQSGSSTLPFLDTTYDGLDPLYSMEPSSWPPFDLQYGGEPIASSSSSNLYMPTPFDSSLSQYPNTRTTPIRPTFTDSSGTPVDGVADRTFPEPRITLTVEMHEVLYVILYPFKWSHTDYRNPSRIQTFIDHRKQCCFYSNTSRFDPSSSATVYQHTPPNSALMSAIYLMGSFFARTPVLEKQFLEQSLQDVSRSLHNQDQLMDVIQALCLLAQYFFFQGRSIEGNAHLKNAKQIAMRFGLNQITYSTFDFSDSPDEKAAIFWQMFIVDNLWSSSNDCCEIVPNLESPCRYITTPLPVLEGVEMESVIGNSPVVSWFQGSKSDRIEGNFLAVPAFKALASCIFDRAMRIRNASASVKDSEVWAYYRATELALERLSAIVHPFTWRDSQNAAVDTDLFAVHTMILVSTIHLHLDNIMNLKVSWAAKKIVELVNHLSDEDYQYLDPALALCWSSVVKNFQDMIEGANEKMILSGASTSMASYTITFLGHCVDVVQSAMQNLSLYVPLAGVSNHFSSNQDLTFVPLFQDTFLKSLRSSLLPACPGLVKTVPSFGQEDYIFGPTLVL